MADHDRTHVSRNERSPSTFNSVFILCKFGLPDHKGFAPGPGLFARSPGIWLQVLNLLPCVPGEKLTQKLFPDFARINTEFSCKSFAEMRNVFESRPVGSFSHCQVCDRQQIPCFLKFHFKKVVVRTL